MSIHRVCVLVAVFAIVTITLPATAAIVSVGPGSAVDDVDRFANFNDVAQSQSLSGYTEDEMVISVESTAHILFDPTGGNGGFSGAFHYPGSGSYYLTSITAEDSAEMFAIELNVGNGFSSPITHIHWELLSNSIVIDSGAVSLTSGGVLGLNEPNGFDKLLIGGFDSYELAAAATQSTLNHHLAIDNLVVDLTMPEPASLCLLAVGALFLRRRR